jgi:hypothetical protein
VVLVEKQLQDVHYEKMGWFVTHCISTGGNVIRQVAWVAMDVTH